MKGDDKKFQDNLLCLLSGLEFVGLFLMPTILAVDIEIYDVLIIGKSPR